MYLSIVLVALSITSIGSIVVVSLLLGFALFATCFLSCSCLCVCVCVCVYIFGPRFYSHNLLPQNVVVGATTIFCIGILRKSLPYPIVEH